MSNGTDDKFTQDDIDGTFNQYWRHASNFRNWAMAYGAAVIYLSFDKENAPFGSPANKYIILLAGIALCGQFILALINKYSNWGSFKRAENTKHGEDDSIWVVFACKINFAIWIDLLIDVGTVLLLAIATCLAWKGHVG